MGRWEFCYKRDDIFIREMEESFMEGLFLKVWVELGELEKDGGGFKD